MFQYTIARHVFPNLTIAVEPQTDKPGETQIRLDLAVQKVGNDEACTAFSRYLESFYDVSTSYEGGNNEQLVFRLKSKDGVRDTEETSCVGRFVQHMAAYYAVPVGSIFAQCLSSDSQCAKFVDELAASAAALRGNLEIIDHADTKDIEVVIKKCTAQTDFCAWLESFYNHTRVEENGVVRLTLHDLKGTHDPLGKARHLVQLVHAILNSWGMDRDEVTGFIQPDVAREYCETALGLCPLPGAETGEAPQFYGKDVVVVGSGFSGVSVVIQTLKQLMKDPPSLPIRFQMLERNPAFFAAGLAYGAAGTEHHVNVPAKFFSLDPSDPDDFVNWIRDAQHSGFLGDAQELNIPDELVIPSSDLQEAAVQRRLYSYYLLDRLNDVVVEARAAGAGDVDVRFMEAVKADVAPGKVQVYLKDGQVLEGTDIVLANGHGPVAAPPFLKAIQEDKRVVVDQWKQRDRIDGFLKDPAIETVGVLGTGLSAMDVVVSADKAGFFQERTNRMILISRGGHTHMVLSEGEDYKEPEVDFGKMTLPKTPEEVVGFVAEAFARLKASGVEKIGREHTDEEVFFALAGKIPVFLEMTHLDVAGLLPLLKKYSSLLTTTAVSMAPVIGHTYQHYIDNGQLGIISADPQTVVPDGDGLTVNLKQHDTMRQLWVDALISALPPASTPENVPFFKDMLDKGIVRKHPVTGIGLDVAPGTYKAIDKSGAPLSNVYILGPAIGGEVMMNRGLIGPLYQIVSGLRDEAAAIAAQLASGAHEVGSPVVIVGFRKPLRAAGVQL